MKHNDYTSDESNCKKGFYLVLALTIKNHIKNKCKTKNQCRTNPSHHPFRHPSSSHSSTSDVNRLIEAVQSHNVHLVRDRPSNNIVNTTMICSVPILHIPGLISLLAVGLARCWPTLLSFF